MDNSDLTEPKLLHNHITKKLLNDKMNYVFLDEIQLVKDFDKVVNSLNLRQNVDIYNGIQVLIFYQEKWPLYFLADIYY